MHRGVCGDCGFSAVIFAVGVEGLLFYIRIIIPEQTALFASYPLNISLGSGIRTLFEPTRFSSPPIPVPGIGAIAVVLMSAVLISTVTAFSYYHSDPKHADNVYSLLCITMLLTSPITWYHNCLLLLLPLALLANSLAWDPSSSSKPLLLILILCGIPNQDLIDGLRAWGASDHLPWYVVLGARTGLFGLVLAYGIFWRRLAKDAGYFSVPHLLGSLRVRLLPPGIFH